MSAAAPWFPTRPPAPAGMHLGPTPRFPAELPRLRLDFALRRFAVADAATRARGGADGVTAVDAAIIREIRRATDACHAT